MNNWRSIIYFAMCAINVAAGSTGWEFAWVSWGFATFMFGLALDAIADEYQ